MLEAEPFVKRAPEIAEEILLKAADSHLPKDLRSFAKELFEKQASVDEEKLELPKRISLDDLKKMAQAKGVDLPKVDVNTNAAPEVATDLRKIAERAEKDEINDVLSTAAAIFLEGREKVADRASKLAAKLKGKAE